MADVPFSNYFSLVRVVRSPSSPTSRRSKSRDAGFADNTAECQPRRLESKLSLTDRPLQSNSRMAIVAAHIMAATAG
jgi:hypothetical protein